MLNKILEMMDKLGKEVVTYKIDEEEKYIEVVFNCYAHIEDRVYLKPAPEWVLDEDGEEVKLDGYPEEETEELCDYIMEYNDKFDEWYIEHDTNLYEERLAAQAFKSRG